MIFNISSGHYNSALIKNLVAHLMLKCNKVYSELATLSKIALQKYVSQAYCLGRMS